MQRIAKGDTINGPHLVNMVFGLLLAGFLLTGCGYSSERCHPDYLKYRKQIHRVLVFYPEISIFEELADGYMLRQMEKSRNAQIATFNAVTEVLAGKGCVVQSTDRETMNNAEARSIQSLFRSVNRSIQLHTYGPQLYSTKLKKFEYGLGPVDGVLAKFEADALVLIIGHQTVSAQHPKTWISIAIMEPTGKIIWYGMQGAKEDLDLQTPASALSLVGEALLPFSRSGI